MTTRIVAIGFGVALFACQPAKCANDTGDPALNESEAMRHVDCKAAADHLAELKCKEWRPDFEAFCVSTLDAGVPLRPGCLATITDCAEVDSKCR